MKFRNSILLFIVISLFTYCSRNKDNSFLGFDEFPTTIELTGENIGEKSFVNINPHEALIFDSLIIVTTYDEPYCIYIYHKDNLNLIATSGIRGRAGGEITIPGYCCMDPNKRILWMHDWTRARLAAYPLDSILNNNKYRYKHYIDYPRKLDWLKGLEYIDDTTFLLGGGYERDLLFIINKKGDVKRNFGMLPEKKIDYPKEIRYHLHYSHRINYLSSKNKAIVAYSNFDYFDLYNVTTGEKIRRVSGPDHFEPVMLSNGGVSSFDSKSAYDRVESDEDYIYAMYSGKIQTRMSHDGTQFEKIWPSELHVHDLEGNPIMNIKLDSEFEEFIIDRKNKRIITLGSELEINEGPFRVYEYPKELLSSD